jgi:alanyl-tRNA synthetase
MNSSDIRSKFLQFFAQKNHSILPSAPLVPENDPTVLFNTAGMQPLVPYLLGEIHPEGTRLANVQKCVRTVDLEEVGDDTHLSFFEMLGNWSLGDYFKQESIAWSYEFLTGKEWLNIPKEKLAITVFKGDSDAPKDTESAEIWKSLGIPDHKISYLPKEDNWWSAGETGPCGPDTEIFYFLGEGVPQEDQNVKNCPDLFVEIWNNVFMEYERKDIQTLVKLPKKNVDTGMGLERAATVLSGKSSVYDIDSFVPLFTVLDDIFEKSKQNIAEYTKHSRIIADHIRTAVFLLSDGVLPSNTDQGYILRRLIRRAIRSGYALSYEKPFIKRVAQKVIEVFSPVYDSIKKNEHTIVQELVLEEERFLKTLQQGLKEFEKLISGFQIAFERTGKKITVLSGEKAFKLYDTYGFPLEMTEEIAKEKGFTVDTEGFKNAFLRHQELSKKGSEQKFKGGLKDASEETTKLHTATHLLHTALKKVLGDHVAQKGSNITPERLRFDFSHPQKMTDEEKKQVEDIVNEQIQKGLSVECLEMTVEEAKKKGAIGLFEHKYGQKVKVYSVGDFSCEICGGPHVLSLKDLGVFKIIKEEAVASGVRRIKARVSFRMMNGEL